MIIADHPLHRSGRVGLPHPATTLCHGDEACLARAVLWCTQERFRARRFLHKRVPVVANLQAPQPAIPPAVEPDEAVHRPVASARIHNTSPS